MSAPAELHKAGTVLDGRYRIRRMVAIGGMGVVYQAVAIESRAPVAVKTILPDLVANETMVRRFAREAKTLRRLSHPNIVSVLDEFVADDRLHLVMEWVSGQNLLAYADGHALPPGRVVRIVDQVLDALAHAHEQGVIHRDLKSENILLLADDRVKVVDFGVAKLVSRSGKTSDPRLTRSGITQGTPEYIAPEQAQRRAQIDHRADLYALGVVMFEMLTGRLPFVGSEAIALMYHHVNTPPPRLADVVPGADCCTDDLEAIVACALAKSRDARFDNAYAMQAALRYAAARLGVVVTSSR